MPRVRLLACALFLSLGACGVAGPPAPGASFDARTGESLAHPALPSTFSAERPGLSTIGRDYLSLGPVTVSGRGAPVTWLWCRLGSSIDRGLRGAPPPGAESLVLLVDDVPMSLPLLPWSDAAHGSPWADAGDAGQSYAARITRSQLERIAAAATLEAWIVAAGEPSARYAQDTDTRAGWLDY